MNKFVLSGYVLFLLLEGFHANAQQINTKVEKQNPSLQKMQKPFEGKLVKSNSESKPDKNQMAVSKNVPYNFMFDFQSMPLPVQQRIATNKRNGKKLSEGVYKIYKIQYSNCHTTEQARIKFSFLKTSFSPIGVDMIADGLINLTVHPEVSSVSLKEAILNQRITVNFISETYTVQ